MSESLNRRAFLSVSAVGLGATALGAPAPREPAREVAPVVVSSANGLERSRRRWS